MNRPDYNTLTAYEGRLPDHASRQTRHVARERGSRSFRLMVPLYSIAMFTSGVWAQTRPVASNSPQALAISRNYGKLPLSFEPNRGQTDARVQFLSRGEGYTIYLNPTSATFALQRHTESAVVRMDLAGAASDSTSEPQDKLPGIANYMLGSNRAHWAVNLLRKSQFAECLSGDRLGLLRDPGPARIRFRSLSAG